MNVLWTFYNIVILLVSAAVAWETEQQRRHVRVDVEVPFTIVCQDGNQIHGHTIDMSNSGAALQVNDSERSLAMGEPINFYFSGRPEGCFFEPRIVALVDKIIRIDFGELSLEQEEVLTRVLYSRADSWIDWGKHREEDRPLRTYGRLLGDAIASHIAEQSVVRMPGAGTVLLPAPVGFTAKNFVKLNPSYLPVQLLYGLAAALPDGPWEQIADNTPAIVRHASPHGFVLDWVKYSTEKGWEPGRGPTTDSRASFDAIRVYLWAGMMDPHTRGRTDLAAQTWQQVLLADPNQAEALAGLAAPTMPSASIARSFMTTLHSGIGRWPTMRPKPLPQMAANPHWLQSSNW
jgi:hypothetical protein